VAHAQLKLEWGSEGYYRARGISITNLAHEPYHEFTHPQTDELVVYPDIRNTSYMLQELKLQPTLRLENLAKLVVEITALDDVVWGDNNGLSSAPLFSTNGTNQGFFGGPEQESIAVTRAWIEFQVPVGVLRVGRMPTHWGMGILANGGGSGTWDPLSPKGEPRRKVADYYFDEDFGDNHFGSTNDRVLFLTKPITIAKTAMKKADTSSNFVVGYAFDKLSEAPLLLDDPTRRSRPFGQQGFLSRGGQQDDVNEHVVIAAYSNPDWDQVRYTDELKFGSYWVFRLQDEAFTVPSEGPGPGVTADDGSFVYVADFWYRIRYGSIYSEAEFYHIGGETTGGVPFPAPNLKKKASINAGAARVGWLTEQWDAILEGGFASGDEDLTDETVKQRPMHPDYNVGLLLFEEIVRERSARVWGNLPFVGNPSSPDGAKGFMSNGGVVNAIYVAPKGRFRPGFGGFEIVGQLLMAWVDKYDRGTANIFTCPENDCETSKLLGTEIDLALKSRFAGDLIDFSLETAYLFFGDPLKTTFRGAANPVAASNAFTLQARVAFVW
jgi:hypothetical protein